MRPPAHVQGFAVQHGSPRWCSTMHFVPGQLDSRKSALGVAHNFGSSPNPNLSLQPMKPFGVSASTAVMLLGVGTTAVVGPVRSRSEFELLIGRRGFVTFALERLVAKPPIPFTPSAGRHAMRATTTSPGPPQLESFGQAEAQNLRRVDALTDRAPEIAAALERCNPDAFCCLVICTICSRRYRFRIIRRLLAIATSRPGQHEVATIFLEAFPAGTLATAVVKRAHDRLRKRLRRSGFEGSHLIGGTEVSWDSATRSWTLHIHVLAIGVPPAAWTRLRKALRGVGPKYPVKVQRLRNPERQISYLITFITYFRPRSRSGGARSSAVPLPPDRLAELAEWWSRYAFDDFTFLLGAKRRGGRIGVES